MNNLVKIGSRIINLDQLIYARATGEGENREVMLMFEKPNKIRNTSPICNGFDRQIG